LGEQAARFGVKAGDGRQSSVWRIWVPTGKSDVYVAARSIAGKLKVSLHSSGVWREGFTREFSENPGSFALPPGDRARQKWRRPAEFAPGLTMAYQVLIPESELWRSANIANPSDVLWERPAGRGQETVFSVILMRSEAVGVEGWPSRDAMATRLIARFGLANGETCWLVAHDQVTHPDNRRTIDEFKRFVESQRPSLSKVDDWSSIRGIILAVNPETGTRKSVELRLSD
jgi:hypothetical protein